MSRAYQQIEGTRWPSGDCRSVAMLGLEPQELQAHLSITFLRDIDDLDYHLYAWLRLASGRQVLLLRYEGNQYPGTEALVDVGDNPSTALRELLDALELTDATVTWTPEDVTLAREAVA